MTQMLIIGGSDAGISAALRIREMDPQADITVVVADAYPNFSICGLPFLLSGEVRDWQSLAHRSILDIERQGIRLLLNHRALEIDAQRRRVVIAMSNTKTRSLAYDRLLIATGADSVKPDIPGINQNGVFTLRWMVDAFAMLRTLTKDTPTKAVIIGGGYIGLEMADALTRRGLTVSLVEWGHRVLSAFDDGPSDVIAETLQANGVRVLTKRGIQAIAPHGNALMVETTCRESIPADVVLVATGVVPSTELALTADIDLGVNGAISVDRSMATSTTDIWAAGDCVQTWHRLMKHDVFMPLGTTAHKQGRVAGCNMAGGSARFEGSLGTQVIRIFDQVAARTGLTADQALVAGFDPLTVSFSTWDHKLYYPEATRLTVHMTGDRVSGQLLGAQILGHQSAEISKRLDILATALFHNARIADLCDLDLSYTPPLSSPWDPVQMAAMEWCNT